MKIGKATVARSAICTSNENTIVVLCVAVVLESFSLRTAVIETRHVKPADESYWHFIRHTKSAELPVVLLEDLVDVQCPARYADGAGYARRFESSSEAETRVDLGIAKLVAHDLEVLGGSIDLELADS